MSRQPSSGRARPCRLGATHSSVLPSINALLPLVVLLGERPKEPLDTQTANGILYWFLVATIRNRYSSSADTLLGQDIPATRGPEPVKSLLANLGLAGARVDVTTQALAGRTVGSPYFFLSFLVSRVRGAKDWFHGAGIDLGGEQGHKLEYHHIHPRATLRDRYSKAEINDLANLAFISASANRRISDQSPADYFPKLDAEELAAHLVPLEERLRTADAYQHFLAARRALMAEAMTDFLNRFRPAWLDQDVPEPGDDLEECELVFTRFESDWDDPKLLIYACDHDNVWQAVLHAAALEDALAQAENGIATDIDLAGQQLAVRTDEDGNIEMEMGPFLVTGSATEWKAVVERERTDPQPLSQAPTPPEPTVWDGPRRRFPVASSE
jgi:hypothetical protein